MVSEASRETSLHRRAAAQAVDPGDFFGGQQVIQTASLADAIAIACSVQRGVNMHVIGVRCIRARTKHGREPSARGSPDRVNDVSHRFISVWLYGN